MEAKINKIVLVLIAFLPFIIYLNYSLHLPQVLEIASYEKMSFLQIILATGLFYLPIILGIYAVVARSTWGVVLFTAAMLAIATLSPVRELKIIEVVELLIFSVALLWFLEWSCSYAKLVNIKAWAKLAKPYLSATSLLMLPITLIAAFVLAFSKLIACFSLKLSDSLELSSVYSILISLCIVLGFVAIIKIWKK
ncbi:MAG: hypothetical protein QMD21_00205 [Candidatus Thermoplasmatota archaeon]|nr:hypothetical protein [Candidatus Thermoplasmatota archaeon]